MQHQGSQYCICLDDDPVIHRIIGQILGLTTLPYVSAAKLLERAAKYDPIAAFIDVHLDGESGLNVLAGLRTAWPYCALFVMTADDEPAVIGDALSLGANDFFRKPLEAIELNARFRARMFELSRLREVGQIRYGDLVCDPGKRLAMGPETHTYLSQSEWDLLAHLLKVPEQVIPKQELKGVVWGDLSVSDNSVDRKLTDIRRSLKSLGSKVQVVAVYGKGVSLKIAS